MRNILLTSLLPVVFAAPVAAREWTNQSGQKIEADFVSSDGTTVTLKRAGKEIPYQVSKLSAADQEFIKSEAAAKPAVMAATGRVENSPIVPAYPEQKQYLTTKNAKAIYQAFDKGDFPSTWDVNKKDAAAEFAYDTTTAKAHVYVPSGYNGIKPFGIYLHISPEDNGEKGAQYAPVMDRLSLIYISPIGTSNKQPMLRRMKLAVDALSSVRAKYKVDPLRICIGGTSGGGHMAMLTHAMFPEMFVGSVSHAAQSYLPNEGSCGHFPGLDDGDLKAGLLREHKWCVISGDRDQNYQAIQETSALWEKGRYHYKFIDVPGMGHSNAAPADLEEALKWIGP
jgi:predicted esterase